MDLKRIASAKRETTKFIALYKLQIKKFVDFIIHLPARKPTLVSGVSQLGWRLRKLATVSRHICRNKSWSIINW